MEPKGRMADRCIPHGMNRKTFFQSVVAFFSAPFLFARRAEPVANRARVVSEQGNRTPLPNGMPWRRLDPPVAIVGSGEHLHATMVHPARMSGVDVTNLRSFRSAVAEAGGNPYARDHVSSCPTFDPADVSFA